MTTVIKTLNEKSGKVTLIEDSECVITAVEIQSPSLGAYYAIQVMQIQDLQRIGE